MNRFKKLNLTKEQVEKLKERELREMLFPERFEDYLPLEPYKEWYRGLKHQTTLRLRWRRYCRRAKLEGKKAYTLSRFADLYNDYFEPSSSLTPKELEYMKLTIAEKTLANVSEEAHKKAIEDKEEWLLENGLEEEKIKK